MGRRASCYTPSMAGLVCASCNQLIPDSKAICPFCSPRETRSIRGLTRRTGKTKAAVVVSVAIGLVLAPLALLLGVRGDTRPAPKKK